MASNVSQPQTCEKISHICCSCTPKHFFLQSRSFSSQPKAPLHSSIFLVCCKHEDLKLCHTFCYCQQFPRLKKTAWKLCLLIVPLCCKVVITRYKVQMEVFTWGVPGQVFMQTDGEPPSENEIKEWTEGPHAWIYLVFWRNKVLLTCALHFLFLHDFSTWHTASCVSINVIRLFALSWTRF